MLIGLAGVRRSGKDMVADYLVRNHGYIKYALASPLKSACKMMFDLSHEQVHGDSKDAVDPRYGVTPRELFQRVGTDCARAIKPTLWIDKFIAWYESRAEVHGKALRVVVSDVRFQNEIDAIRALGGKVYLVRRPGSREHDAHVSEHAHALDVDGHIANEGSLDDLHDAARVALMFGP